eukprot:gene8520-10844_t
MVFPTGGPFARHPSQLYEAALEGLVLLAVIAWFIYRRHALKSPGLVTGIFVLGYAASRIFVEFFREPDAQIGYLAGGWLTMGMLLSLPMALAGIWAIARARRAATLIRTNGPISVTDYFSLCLADPEYGYYRVREPFGKAGDFTTAPEISQLFGEMIGIFLVHAWQQHGTPEQTVIVEIGPGRGTMMADVLRVVRRLSPELYAAASVHLVETSDRLRKVQAETLV